jgi:hypothetical protein
MGASKQAHASWDEVPTVSNSSVSLKPDESDPGSMSWKVDVPACFGAYQRCGYACCLLHPLILYMPFNSFPVYLPVQSWWDFERYAMCAVINPQDVCSSVSNAAGGSAWRLPCVLQVAIYSESDRLQPHRYKADES